MIQLVLNNNNNNKMKNIFKLNVIALLMLLVSCDEIENGPYNNDGVAPDDILNVDFTPINGGFDVIYDLPEGKDVLFVEAVYIRSKGGKVRIRTSAFNNKMTILGYGDINEKTVEIFTVDRGGNKSKGVSFKGVPLTPVVDVVAASSEVLTGFGGAKYSWTNETEVPLTIEIYAEDSKGELKLVDEIYSDNLEEKFSLRGYESTPLEFKMRIRDRYDNFSDFIEPDTSDKKLTPLFEERLDKTKFQQVTLDNDVYWEAWGYSFDNVYDDDFSDNNMIHTYDGSAIPMLITIDLGEEVELSRFKLYQRSGQYGFIHANPKDYTAYGSLTLPGQDGNLDDWIKLRECHSIKPSGLPLGAPLSDEERDIINNGEEWEFDELVKIRYFRLAIYSTWGGKTSAHFRELTFWGNIVDN